MTGAGPSYIYLPGAGGGSERDVAGIAAQLKCRPEAISYPGWPRYIRDDFSAEALLTELTAEVVARVPSGPVGIIGLSLGGHLGYSIALRLLAMGREVDLLCVIDSFMFASSSASVGWQRKVFSDAMDTLRRRSPGHVARFVRSRAWRAFVRLAEGRLPLHRFSDAGRLPFILRVDPLAEQELSMRLLLRNVTPWVAQLDADPAALKVPSILIRTTEWANHDAAWKQRCPEIVIREVPGTHETLLQPETMRGINEAFASAMTELAAPSSLR